MKAVAAVVAFFSSMRLSVVIVVLLGLLTWLGTLAQVDKGLYEVQRDYFESWFVICELPVSFWSEPLWLRADGSPGVLKIPLPGAYPLMILLFINLLVGGLVRFKRRWRNVGVLIAHVGIGLLLVAGFVKLHYSVAGHLALFEQSANGAAMGDRQTSSAVYVSFHDYELALLREVQDGIEERVVPEATIAAARGGNMVEVPCAGLPFRIEISHFHDNVDVRPKGPMFAAQTPVIDGMFMRPKRPHMKREANEAGCYVTVHADDGSKHEGIVVGYELRPYTKYRYPFTFSVGGQRWGLDLRRVTRDLPFAVRLDKFSKTDHPGTLTPADFRSFVTVREGEGEQKVQIYMNTPLRRDGYVLFQTNWGPQDEFGRPDPSGPPWYSVFEVAQNPSDQWPHIACWVIAFGLATHFIMKLVKFLNSSSREAMSP